MLMNRILTLLKNELLLIIYALPSAEKIALKSAKEMADSTLGKGNAVNFIVFSTQLYHLEY